MVKIINFKSICRTCMGTDNVIPIFNNKNKVKKYSMLICLTTGIKIDSNDGLPQNICKTCISLINQSIKFRLLCKETANKLLNIKNKINRKITKEKDLIKIGQTFDKSDEGIEKCVALTNDFSFKSNYDDESSLNIGYSELNIQNLIKTDTVTTDFSENLHKNIDINSTLTKDHDPILYSEDNPIEIKIFDDEQKNNNDIEESDTHNETEFDDNYNLNYSDDGLSYDQDMNIVKLYDLNIDNDPMCNDNEIYNAVPYDSNTTNKMKLYNNNDSDNKKSYNDNEKSYTDNEKSYTDNESSFKTDSRAKYMIITKNNRVICKICNKNLALRSFDAHIWKCHPGVDERKILCSLCHDYIAKNRMNTHVVKHGNDFTCVYCNNDHGSKELLIEHTASCSKKIKRRNRCETTKELKECDICHKKMQKGSLRLHKEVKHAGLGPICEHCNKKFSNKFRLMEHLRAKHGYDKIKCKLCDFQTASVMSLKNHERRHAGIKPFLCETCGAKFHAAYLLAQHRNSHTTEKIYKCEQCPASFKTNNGLHMHRMTCHSNKSLNCSICARAYNCRHYLVRHMRGVHRVRGPIPNLQDG